MRSIKAPFSASLVLALGLALTACGSDDTASDKDDAGHGLTGTPVKVGHFNPAGGPAPQPGAGTGAQAAVKYINEELKGIGGRPIELVNCDVDGSPEKTTSCANSFVEEGVVAALDGFNLSASAAMPVLTSAKIPLVGMIPFDLAAGASTENRVFLAAPQPSFLIGAMQAFKADGKDSISLALVKSDSAQQTIDMLLPAVGGALEMDATGFTFDGAKPNFTATAATIAKDNPDVGGLMASPNEAYCTSMVTALRQQGYEGTIFTAACTDFITAAPGDSTGGALYTTTWLPAAAEHAPAEVQDDLAAAEKAISGVEGGTGGFYAYSTFAQFVTFAQALADTKEDPTGESVLSTLKGLKDFESFLGPKLDCTSKKMPNCTTEMLLLEVQDDQTVKPATGGWIQPPAELIEAILGG